MKKRELSDVTMSAYDGTEICELVGLLMLCKFQQLNKINNFGLYRDDELAVVKNRSGPQSKKVKKELQVLFVEFRLKLIIECNKRTADYLNTTLNLLDGKYKPYQKPEKHTTGHSQKIHLPSKCHQRNFSYNRNTTSKPFNQGKRFLSCSRRL